MGDKEALKQIQKEREQVTDKLIDSTHSSFMETINSMKIGELRGAYFLLQKELELAMTPMLKELMENKDSDIHTIVSLAHKMGEVTTRLNIMAVRNEELSI